MKKKTVFFMGCSGNQSFAAGNVAIGINKYIKANDYDILIYYSDFDEDDFVAFSRIEHCILIEYKIESEFETCMLNGLPPECRFATKDRLMCFSHFEAFNLLDEYERVIWLDTDILIQGDISCLTNYETVSIPSDDGFLVSDQFIQCPDDNYNYEIEALQISTMILPDSIPYKGVTEWCYNKAVEMVNYLLNPEQAIINLALQEYLIPYQMLSRMDQVRYLDKDALFSKMVHFGGERKVWNDVDICSVFPEWYRNYEEWISLGGKKSPECTITRNLLYNSLEYIRYYYLFPYNKVKPHSRVILYGFGKVGKSYFYQIMRTKYCNIIGIVDKNCNNQHGNVVSPEKINELGEFDFVIISVLKDDMRKEIYSKLLNLGVVPNRIIG